MKILLCSLDGISSRNCNEKLISREDLYARAADIAAYKTRHGEQWIIPSINFTSKGELLRWTFAAEWGAGTRLPEIQIWRSSAEGSGHYSRVQSLGETIPLQTGDLNVYNSILHPPLSFQPGDILGLYLPPQDSSQLDILFMELEEPTTTGYTIDVALQVEQVDLSHSQIQREHMLPLIAIGTGENA